MCCLRRESTKVGERFKRFRAHIADRSTFLIAMRFVLNALLLVAVLHATRELRKGAAILSRESGHRDEADRGTTTALRGTAMLAPAARPVLVSPAIATGSAAVADEASSCSLKDVSRTAARAAERELILKILQRNGWNRKEAAKILGISYKAILYKVKEYGLSKAS